MRFLYWSTRVRGGFLKRIQVHGGVLTRVIYVRDRAQRSDKACQYKNRERRLKIKDSKQR